MKTLRSGTRKEGEGGCLKLSRGLTVSGKYYWIGEIEQRNARRGGQSPHAFLTVSVLINLFPLRLVVSRAIIVPPIENLITTTRYKSFVLYFFLVLLVYDVHHLLVSCFWLLLKRWYPKLNMCSKNIRMLKVTSNVNVLSSTIVKRRDSKYYAFSVIAARIPRVFAEILHCSASHALCGLYVPPDRLRRYVWQAVHVLTPRVKCSVSRRARLLWATEFSLFVCV